MIMLETRSWITPVRRLAAFGLFAYIASFFFFSGTLQKTLFYLLVALPSLALLPDLGQILRGAYKLPVLSVLSFLIYFAASTLWSDDGQLGDGLKLFVCIACLMVAVHSSSRLSVNISRRVLAFILITGSLASVFYALFFAVQLATAEEYRSVLANRHSLRTLSGWGDSNPINSSLYFGTVVLAAWWSFPKKRPLVKAGLVLLISTSLVLMLLTKSRGPIASLLVALLVITLCRRQRDDWILWGIALAASLAAMARHDLIALILDRVGSPNYRAGIWMHAIQIIRDNIYFGQGVGTSAQIPIPVDQGVVIVGHSHSSLIETFRVGGMLGGGLFLVMLYSVIRISWKADGDQLFFLAWLTFGLLCLSTNGRLPFIRPSVEWFAFWLPLFFLLFASARTNFDSQQRRMDSRRTRKSIDESQAPRLTRGNGDV